MMGSSNLAAGFIDLATYDEVEKYMYGGGEATTYFVRAVRKSTWFTQVPTILTKSSGLPGFGQEWSVNITRAGDYLMYAWLHVVIPEVTLLAGNQFGANGRLRWTRNLGHNLVKECQITFNDLTAARFDSNHLDFWAAFTTPASKATGYRNMIGDVPTLTDPYAPGVTIPSWTINLPLPFFFARDKGVAIPAAAIPYNEMRISFVLRDWTELLILDQSNVAGSQTVVPQVPGDIATAPTLPNVQVWANYAIVSNDERKRMSCSPRSILIEQVQTSSKMAFAPATNPDPLYDQRFSHAIKVIFFAIINKTFKNVQSNYTTNSADNNGVTVNYVTGVDPIESASLIYESTTRLSHMTADYYSLVQPWFTAPTIPTATGYHMYSYSTDFECLDPMGSTNFGKLTNVSMGLRASAQAIVAANGTGPATSGSDFKQTFEFVTTVVNNNVIAISGGALGFPVL